MPRRRPGSAPRNGSGAGSGRVGVDRCRRHAGSGRTRGVEWRSHDGEGKKMPESYRDQFLKEPFKRRPAGSGGSEKQVEAAE